MANSNSISSYPTFLIVLWKSVVLVLTSSEWVVVVQTTCEQQFVCVFYTWMWWWWMIRTTNESGLTSFTGVEKIPVANSCLWLFLFLLCCLWALMQWFYANFGLHQVRTNSYIYNNILAHWASGIVSEEERICRTLLLWRFQWRILMILISTTTWLANDATRQDNKEQKERKRIPPSSSS